MVVPKSEPSTPTQTASHAPSLGLGGNSGPIILLIGAGFAISGRTWCATRGQEMTLRLLGEVHLAEKGLEARVGAEGVKPERHLEIPYLSVAFLGSLLQM